MWSGEEVHPDAVQVEVMGEASQSVDHKSWVLGELIPDRLEGIRRETVEVHCGNKFREPRGQLYPVSVLSRQWILCSLDWGSQAQESNYSHPQQLLNAPRKTQQMMRGC